MPECHYKRLVQDRDQLEHVIPDNPEDIPVPCLTCHSVGTDHSGGVLSKQYYYHSEALRLFRDIQFHLESRQFRNLAAQRTKPYIPFSRLITDSIFQ